MSLGTAPADAFPTTAAQAAIWFADQRHGNAAYHTTVAFRIDGDLGRAHLESAFRRLVETTPALCLRMGLDPRGEVVQWFSDAPHDVRWVDSPVTDVAGPDLDPLLWGPVTEPFQSDGGPLCRAVVGRVGKRRTALVLVLHHLVNDGTSQEAVAGRFVDCLEGRVQPQAPRRYVELVALVRHRESQARSDDRDYWAGRAQRRGGGPWSVPDRAPTAGSHLRHRISGRHAGAIGELARAVGGSQFLVQLGAVHRGLAGSRSGGSTVCVGASVRPRDGRCDDVAGCFVNLVPLTARHEDGETFTGFLAREVPAWREDLSRRHLPLAAHPGDTPPGKPALRPERVIVTARRSAGRVTRRCGPFEVTTDLFKKYVDAKADLEVRFIRHPAGLEYDVSWGAGVPRTDRERLSGTVQTLLTGGRS